MGVALCWQRLGGGWHFPSLPFAALPTARWGLGGARGVPSLTRLLLAGGEGHKGTSTERFAEQPDLLPATSPVPEAAAPHGPG